MESQIGDENAVSRQNIPRSTCKASATKSKLRRALTVTFPEENGKNGPLDDEDLSLIPGRPSMFKRENLMVEGISRIESVGDVNESQFTESFGLSDSTAAESANMSEVVKFETTIEEQAYIVTILQNETSMVASFFNVSKGVTQVRRLNSTWRNPPIGSQSTKNDWYKENIAAVLVRNRGPEATPKQPPRRAPPTAAEPVRLATVTDPHSITSQSRSDESMLRQASTEVSRLRHELQDAAKHHADLTSQLECNAKEFEGRLAEWKQRLEDSQTAAECSRREWTQMVAQRDAEIELLKSKHFEERERLLKEISIAKDAEAHVRQEVLELRLALRRAEERAETMSKLEDDLHQPTAKRVRTEQEIWAEAEKILALSRADVAEARQGREAAELRAREQEMKAKEAIENCEKILNTATARIAELESKLQQPQGN